MTIRPVDVLANVADPAWETIKELAAQSPSALVIEVDPGRGREVLWRLQVTAHSYLGAIALNSGGVLADYGWFRLFGGGSPHLADLAAANRLGEPTLEAIPPGYLLVGHDAVGGRFGIDGGGLGAAAGEVCYFGPDSLAWGGLGTGYAEFVTATIGGHLAAAFDSLRWRGWREEIEQLRPDQGLSIFPPPFSREGKDIAAASRRPVPMQELLNFYDDCARQLNC